MLMTAPQFGSSVAESEKGVREAGGGVRAELEWGQRLGGEGQDPQETVG